MKKRDWNRIAQTGAFNLYRDRDNAQTYSVRWKRSNRPGYGNVVFSALDDAQAFRVAAEKVGLVRPEPSLPVLSLGEAFGLTLKDTKRGPSGRKDYLYQVKRFDKWLEEHHPEVEMWGQLSRPLLREYLGGLEHLADHTRRLYFQPISQTDRFLAREYGFPRIAEGLATGTKLVRPTAHVYLRDVVDFLDWLREHKPYLEAGVALQGLAGLQLQEATRLTWDRVDMGRGLVEISGVIKNDYRERVIPVVGRVVEALRRAHANRPKVRAVGPEPVLAGGAEWKSYSRAVRRAYLLWTPNIDWTTKDLRNCLPAWATAEGVKNDLWEMYIGHAPGNVTARHYVPHLNAVSKGGAAEIDKEMDQFRRAVCHPLEQAILHLFSPEQQVRTDEGAN